MTDEGRGVDLNDPTAPAADPHPSPPTAGLVQRRKAHVLVDCCLAYGHIPKSIKIFAVFACKYIWTRFTKAFALVVQSGICRILSTKKQVQTDGTYRSNRKACVGKTKVTLTLFHGKFSGDSQLKMVEDYQCMT